MAPSQQGRLEKSWPGAWTKIEYPFNLKEAENQHWVISKCLSLSMLLATQCLWAHLTHRHTYLLSKGNKPQTPNAVMQLTCLSDKQSGLGIGPGGMTA